MTRLPVSLIIVCAALQGCSGFPVSGPQSTNIGTAASAQVEVASDFQYELVTMVPETAQFANLGTGTSLSRSFGDRRPPAEIRLGIGDVVGVTIFEAAAGGLFIPSEAGSRAGNFVALPNQTVDRAGNISVPYAGAIKAAGLTPAQIQTAIADRLRNRAIEPQAVVSIVEQRSQLVSVLGEVNSPLRAGVTASGERLLDTISRAGGIKGNGVDLWVRLIRNGREQPIPFTKLTSEPQNNIYTMPNDTIYLYRDPLTFLAFGASGSQGQFSFEAERLTLAEAVAKAGGLLDDRAEPGAVFLYRQEPRAVAAKLGIDVLKYPGNRVPVIYSLNLRDPKGFFTASTFHMRSRDVIFVANAASVEVTKFLQFLRVGVAAVRESNAASIEVK